jgi:opacity protein-like surface antigen
MIATRIALAVLAGACSLAASEGEGPEPFRYGVQVLAALPRQDLKALDSRTGLGAGLFAENDLGAGLVVQSRIDFFRFPQTSQPNVSSIGSRAADGALTLSANSLAVGVDVHKHLAIAGLESGFVLAGVTCARYEFQTSAAVETDSGTVIQRFKDKTPFKLGLAVGIGYDFNATWSLALRYTSVSTDNTTFATFETGLSYRF